MVTGNQWRYKPHAGQLGGELSKRSSRRRGGRSTSPFVMLHWHLIDSQGWHALSPHARLAYLELARLYSGDNNGCISLSARRLARQMPCDKATASRALRELEDAGFIETLRVGTFTRKDRLASEYRLCNYTCERYRRSPETELELSPLEVLRGYDPIVPHGCPNQTEGGKLPSTVSLNRTVKPQTEYSTVQRIVHSSQILPWEHGPKNTPLRRRKIDLERRFPPQEGR